MTPFQGEIKAFEEALPGLLEQHHLGAYAVLNSCRVEQVLPTLQQALSWGYERYGLDQKFLVKQVQEPQHLTHYRRIR